MSQQATETRETAGDAAGTGTIYQDDIVRSSSARFILAFGRIALGWYFIWAFMDKLFGLGYATPAERAWLNGGKPAQGFMANAEGPFAGIFHWMAQTFGAFNDVLFHAGPLRPGRRPPHRLRAADRGRDRRHPAHLHVARDLPGRRRHEPLHDEPLDGDQRPARRRLHPRG